MHAPALSIDQILSDLFDLVSFAALSWIFSAIFAFFCGYSALIAKRRNRVNTRSPQGWHETGQRGRRGQH
jgi:hypothetical protein